MRVCDDAERRRERVDRFGIVHRRELFIDDDLSTLASDSEYAGSLCPGFWDNRSENDSSDDPTSVRDDNTKDAAQNDAQATNTTVPRNSIAIPRMVAQEGKEKQLNKDGSSSSSEGEDKKADKRNRGKRHKKDRKRREKKEKRLYKKADKRNREKRRKKDRKRREKKEKRPCGKESSARSCRKRAKTPTRGGGRGSGSGSPDNDPSARGKNIQKRRSANRRSGSGSSRDRKKKAISTVRPRPSVSRVEAAAGRRNESAREMNCREAGH
uniref:G_PROTEIN_RECEP_F1_2 domain-containing protein n=1 Tax=Steinernema glaseri TaxID=37863 RepID=A0A1I7ZHU4_9BILA